MFSILKEIWLLLKERKKLSSNILKKQKYNLIKEIKMERKAKSSEKKDVYKPSKTL